MLDLFKADLRRVLRDRLFLIVCIIAAVLSASTPLLYGGLSLVAGEEMELTLSIAGISLSGKAMFFDALVPGNNMGLILPVFLVILLVKDFTWGTVRNKVLSGKSRGQIFLSLFLTSAAVTLAVMLAQALLAMAVGSLLFGFQDTAFTGADAGYFALSVLFEILLYLMIAALVALLAVVSPNMGVGIVLYVGVSMLFTLVGGLTTSAVFLFEETPVWLEILNRANLFTSRVIGGGTSYTLKDVLYVLLPSLLGSAGFYAWGHFVFRKKDLK